MLMWQLEKAGRLFARVCPQVRPEDVHYLAQFTFGSPWGDFIALYRSPATWVLCVFSGRNERTRDRPKPPAPLCIPCESFEKDGARLWVHQATSTFLHIPRYPKGLGVPECTLLGGALLITTAAVDPKAYCEYIR